MKNEPSSQNEPDINKTKRIRKKKRHYQEESSKIVQENE
jgi:hypothetical protein